MNNDSQEKRKNESDAPIPIIINNNTTLPQAGRFQWQILVIVVIISIGVGIFLRQSFDFSNYFDWWTKPASLNISDNIFIPEVEHIRSMAELTTTRYNYADVFAGQSNMPAWLSALYGDSVIMVAVGTIEAGIDFTILSEEGILFDEENMTLNITLPSPVLQNCFLNERKSYVVDRNTAFFADTRDDLEDSVRQQALIYYRDQALEEGILADAQMAAETAIGNLLTILVDNTEVTIAINFAEAVGDLELPDNCQ